MVDYLQIFRDQVFSGLLKDCENKPQAIQLLHEEIKMLERSAFPEMWAMPLAARKSILNEYE